MPDRYHDSKQRESRVALRMAAIYFLIGAAWIIGADIAESLVLRSTFRPEWFDIAKGLAFVTVTALFFYQLMHRTLRRRARAEEERRKAAAVYRAVVEDLPVLVSRFRADGTVTFVNDFCCRYFGRTRDQFVGQSFKPLIPPEDHGVVREALTALTRDHPVYVIEHRVFRPDGSIRWQRWTNRALFDNAGNIAEYQGIGEDITDARAANDRVRVSEERYRQLVELSPEAIYVICDGRFVFANPAGVRLLGAQLPAEILGMPVLDRIHPDDQVTVRQRLALVLTTKLTNPPLQLRMLSVDGRTVDIESTSSPYIYEGKPAIRVIARDITEQLQAGRRLSESEMRYRSLFQNMMNGLAYCRMIYDGGHPVDFVYLDVNQAFERLTGLKNVVGKKVSDVIPGIREDDPEVIQFYGRVARTGTPASFEVFVKALNSWFSVSAYSPAPDHFIAVFDVITERKRIEESLKLFRMQIDHSTDAIEVLDAATGRFLDVNARALSELGYSREELLALDVFAVDPTLEREHFASNVDRLREAGFITRNAVHRRKDGTTFPVEIGVTFVHLDRDYLVAVARGSTERKQAQAGSGG